MVVFLLLAILIVLLIATGLWRNVIVLIASVIGGLVLLALTTSYGWQFWLPVLGISVVCLALELFRPLARLKLRQERIKDAEDKAAREKQAKQAVVDKAARKEAAIRAQVEATERIGK
ncbi:hypothetical protein [Salinicola endophyticus]|uniref:Uncharacterized protein n=1 Tax=Salinicola endophyticus TaxID=1949083 RepID=A0AB74U727_9GAMM